MPSLRRRLDSAGPQHKLVNAVHIVAAHCPFRITQALSIYEPVDDPQDRGLQRPIWAA